MRGANEASDLWIVNADGTGLRQLTHLAPRLMNLSQPEGSPDGLWIVFGAWENLSRGDTRIFVVDAEGGGLRSLTPSDSVSDYGPSWSPDGTKIVFFSDSGTAFGPDLPSWGLEVMSADGSTRTRLATISTLRCPCEIPRFDPSWSPNGRQIVFAADRDDNRDIYVINPDGTGQRRLTTAAAVDAAPAWQPAVDLILTQRVRPARARIGEKVRSTIIVRNVAQRDSHAVRVTGSLSTSKAITVSTNRGRCSSGRVFRCDLGALGREEAATVNVSARADRVGRLVFTAATTSAEAEATEANNGASTRALIVARR